MKRKAKTQNVTPQEKPRISTASVYADRRLTSIEMQATHDLERAEQSLIDFSAKLQRDAVYALEWSADIFKQAAASGMAKLLLSYITNFRNADQYTLPSSERIIRIIRHELYAEVLRRAKWPEHSTSVQSNEMALALNARRAEWLESFDRAIEAIEAYATITL